MGAGESLVSKAECSRERMRLRRRRHGGIDRGATWNCSYGVGADVSLSSGVLLAVVGLFVGGMAGKGIGLRRADVRFRHAVARIEQDLGSSTDSSPASARG